ncbi:MAG: four helix bundle protein [Candidatus Saccharimonadales bacterium]
MKDVYSYKDLVVWQKSFELARRVYALSGKLPKFEQYGLASQLQRSAVSIPSNIAEGQQRNSSGEYKQFLGVAKGSSAELETQLLLLKDVYGFDAGAELILLGEVQKMLSAIVSKLSTSH